MIQRRLSSLAILSLVAILLTAVIHPASRTDAASLTSNYSYVINGQEVAVGIDPLVLQSGALIPVVALNGVGVQFLDQGASSFSLTRGGVTVNLKTGSTNATRGEETTTLPSPPVKVTGQVFVPVAALELLGIEVRTESNIVFIQSVPAVNASSINEDEYERLIRSLTADNWIEPVRDTSVQITVTHLTQNLIMHSSWTSDPFLRGRVHELLRTNLVLQVTIKNPSTQVLSFPKSNYYLVDNLGNQYSLSDQWIPVSGDLFGNIAPGAKVSGLMVYPAMKPGARTLSFYYLNNTEIETLGVFTLSVK